MSLNIYIAHTGEHLLADPVSFASYVFLLLVYPSPPSFSSSFLVLLSDTVRKLTDTIYLS
jgi:hypothetical protein